MGHIFAMDFFTVEALTMVGLVRYYVLIVIDIKTRKVHLCGIIHQPHEEWMKQMARNLTDAIDGFLVDARYLIVDRDPLFCKAFRDILADVGVKTLRLPARSPNLNAHVERHIRSIREELLDRVVVLGEGHLRHLISEYQQHFLHERNHQGLGEPPPVPETLVA
jgi:transposase InsO family protein